MSNIDSARNLLPLSDGNSGCACCASASDSPALPASEAGTQTFLVTGMTCSHCVASVTEELSTLEGVDSVEVDLRTGGESRVTVSSASPLDMEKVRDAVGEAGYTLVGAL